MQKHDHIKSVIKNTGLTFTDHGDTFSSFWKISTNIKIKVIVAFDIHPEWVHVLCDVGSVQAYAPSIPNALLRLNNAIIGTKFSLEQNNHIVCSSEILYAYLTDEYLKQRITQIVKMVSLFYEKVEKENLKLNSA